MFTTDQYQFAEFPMMSSALVDALEGDRLSARTVQGTTRVEVRQSQRSVRVSYKQRRCPHAYHGDTSPLTYDYCLSVSSKTIAYTVPIHHLPNIQAGSLPNDSSRESDHDALSPTTGRPRPVERSQRVFVEAVQSSEVFIWKRRPTWMYRGNSKHPLSGQLGNREAHCVSADHESPWRSGRKSNFSRASRNIVN